MIELCLSLSDLTECFDHFKILWRLDKPPGFEKQHLHLVRLLSLRLQHSSKFAWKLENLKIIQLSTRDEFANEHGQSHVTCSIYFEYRLFISLSPRDKKLFDMISLKQTVEDLHEIKRYFRQLAHARENTIALDEIDKIDKASRKKYIPWFLF